MGRKAARHAVDGRQMTVAEAAALLGVSAEALHIQMSRRRLSLQGVVNGYRSGYIGRGRDNAQRHRVHGRWTTVRDETERLGLGRKALEAWRTKHRRADGTRPLLEEAVDHFEALKAGHIARGRPGPKPRKYWVKGRQMTVAEAAEKLGVAEARLRQYVYAHRCSLNTAVRFYEQKAARQAQARIMEILGL